MNTNQNTANHTPETQESKTPFNVYQFPDDIEKVYGDRPQESFRFYLGVDFEKEVPKAIEEAAKNSSNSSAKPAFLEALVPQTAAQEAFIYGYLSALHRWHIYSDALFLTGKSRLDAVKSEVDTRESLSLIAHSVAGLAKALDEYLYYSSEIVRIHPVQMVDAFLKGYQTALIVHKKYDNVLFMDGHVLELTVFCDLEANLQKEENAQRACARMIMKKYGSADKDKLRGMVLDKTVIRDSDGKEVTPERMKEIEARAEAAVRTNIGDISQLP